MAMEQRLRRHHSALIDRQLEEPATITANKTRFLLSGLHSKCAVPTPPRRSGPTAGVIAEHLDQEEKIKLASDWPRNVASNPSHGHSKQRSHALDYNKTKKLFQEREHAVDEPVPSKPHTRPFSKTPIPLTLALSCTPARSDEARLHASWLLSFTAFFYTLWALAASFVLYFPRRGTCARQGKEGAAVARCEVKSVKEELHACEDEVLRIKSAFIQVEKRFNHAQHHLENVNQNVL